MRALTRLFAGGASPAAATRTVLSVPSRLLAAPAAGLLCLGLMAGCGPDADSDSTAGGSSSGSVSGRPSGGPASGGIGGDADCSDGGSPSAAAS